MKKLNEIFCSNVCLTSKKSILVLCVLIFSTLVLASVWPSNTVEEIEEITPPDCKDEGTEVWIPTKEDIEYQDSMYAIIQNTQQDVDTIKQDIDAILYKLDRLEYKDGTSDSIRYVKGGPIDRKRN